MRQHERSSKHARKPMMRFLLRLVGLALGMIFLVILFRGPLFRAVAHYEVIGDRNSTHRSEELSEVVMVPKGDLNEAIDAALDTTANWLHFTTGHASSNARFLTKGSGANCIGYASLFTALLRQELESNEAKDRYKVEHLIGQLHLGDWNVHQAFNSPFWKDHDIVRITDLTEGVSVNVDPTLFDATGIRRVRGPSK